MNVHRLPRLAWGALFFNLAVIVWGAYVRASGSGAGCGSHWPLCNGELVPHTGLLTTAIEFAHRISSGVCLVLAVAIAWLGRREYAQGSPVRSASAAVLGFTLSEALIGAGLVLFRYVDKDQSLGRAVSICLHLSNTFLLLASLALTAWWSSFAPAYKLESKNPRSARIRRLAFTALAATTLLGITGAMTALGDTLFHATSLTSGMGQDFLPTSHFLVKLRILHPALALFTAALLFFFAETASELGLEPRAQKLTMLLKGLVASQLLLGFVNLILLAPIPLQLAHLFVAESLWITLVLTAAASLQEAPESALEIHGTFNETVPC